MPKFVLLKHTLPNDAPRVTHWDFMLERDGTLRTWALDAEPSDGVEMMASQLADHRLAYLDYEGDVSGGRGIVRRCDRGSYTSLCDDRTRLHVALNGERLVGTATLTCDDSNQRWRFVFVAAAAFGGGSSS